MFERNVNESVAVSRKNYSFEIFTSSLTSTSTLVSSCLVVVIFDITLFVSMRFESGRTTCPYLIANVARDYRTGATQCCQCETNKVASIRWDLWDVFSIPNISPLGEPPSP